MKILHIISGGDKGGAKTHMFALLDELTKLADVTVVCLMRGVFYREIIERDVNVVLLEQKNRFDMSVVGKLADMVKNDGYDIVNAHGARANFIAAKLQDRIDVPVVTTIHSDYLLDFDTAYKKLIFEKLNKRALKKIRYKIAVSDAFREMLIRRGFMPNDVLTVYNGMDFTASDEPMPREEFAAAHGIPFDPGCVYVGIAARFDRVKGVDVFIRAAAEVLAERPDVRFVIAGEGDEEAALKELAVQLGVSDRVHFIGFVTPIYDFLNFIDINTLTSRSESFPYSMLEGAKAAKPMVASAVGGIPRLIINGKTGYTFPSEDHAACAAEIVRLANSSELRSSLGSALFEKASGEYSDRALAEKYLENYSSFIRKFGREKRYDVILSGYYGFDNFGDDMILAAILRNLRELRPECEILVLSKSPEKTSLRFGVDSVSRFGVGKIGKVMRDSYAFVNGGGTLLTDVTSTHSLVYYCALLNQAKRRGLKTVILSNGIGPFLRKRNGRRAVRAMEGVDLITLRDMRSYEFVRGSVKGSEPLLSGDLFFADRSYRGENGRENLPDGLKDTRYFAVSLRDSVLCADGFEQKIADVCGRLTRDFRLRAVFVPMQPARDEKISQRTAGLTGENASVLEMPDADQIVSVLSGAEFVIGMRLHALILAVAHSVPVVALSYDQKIENFINENSLANCLDVSDPDEEKLYGYASELASGDASVRERYSSAIDELRARADVSIRKLTELIDGLH